MTRPDFRVGQRVRHKHSGAQGVVTAVVGAPLLRGLPSKVVVRFDSLPGASLARRCWAADLELIDPAVAPQPEPGLTVVTLGVLAEPPTRKVGRFTVIQGDRP